MATDDISYKLRDIKAWLELHRNEDNIRGMARYGIRPAKPYGIPTPEIARKAREYGRDHTLALALWDTGTHEGRKLASMIADHAVITPQTMDEWCSQFDSWDICDQCCIKLFRYTPHVRQKIEEWSVREEEYVKRSAYSLIASLAVSDKISDDDSFAGYFDLIQKAATDPRNFVRKSVNWALRQLGKRSTGLHARAIEVCEELKVSTDRTARWIGADAYRELISERALSRIARTEAQIAKARKRL